MHGFQVCHVDVTTVLVFAYWIELTVRRTIEGNQSTDESSSKRSTRCIRRAVILVISKPLELGTFWQNVWSEPSGLDYQERVILRPNSKYI